MPAHLRIIHLRRRMEPGGRRKRSAGERILVRKRLVKGFFGFGPPRFARSVNWGHSSAIDSGTPIQRFKSSGSPKIEAEISADRRAVGNAADQLIDKKSVCSRMVTVCFTWFPEWFLPSKLSRHRVVIQYGWRGIAESRLTGLMGKNME